MGLNKVKKGSNMYQFIDYTWNPLAGECPHGCSYCSTNKLMRYPGIKNKYSGPPRLHELEMKTKLGKGNFIFVAAQSDLFAEDVPDKVIQRVLDYCDKFDNRYLFQTKNPERFSNYINTPLFVEKSVICTTIETNRHIPHVMNNSPVATSRAMAMRNIVWPEKYITIEPIMDFCFDEMVEIIKNIKPIQVNIGADSGNNNLPEPSKEKILALISELEKFTKVKQKSNLARLLK